MKSLVLTVTILFAVTASSAMGQFTEVYSTDFTAAEGFVDGGIAGQNGWEGQADWTISDSAGAGFVTASGNWQRARTFNGIIASSDLAEGAQVGITATLGFDGFLFATNEFFRLGLGAQPEHTGAQTPQVHANFAYDGIGNITAGDASVAYNSGDVLTVDMVITRGTNETDWGLETTLTNVTQELTSGPVSSTPVDQTGTIGFADGGIDPGTPTTLHEYIEAGANTMLAFRMLNNVDLLSVNLDSMALSLAAVVPEVAADYNGNGVVDGSDYLLWQQQNGQTGPDLAADGTGDDLLGVPDEDVDAFDLGYWQDNYGPGTLAAAAVPEPGSLVLLLVGLMIANRRGSPVRNR